MRIIAPLLVLCLISPAWAEVVHLTDGTSVTGSVKRQGDGWVITGADGKTTYLPANRVEAIDLTSKFTDPNQAADAGLQGLRTSTQNSSDVDAVLKRYNDFVLQNKDTPSVREAQKDLAIWQERKDRGLVHIGGKWVTHEEAGNISQESVGAAEQARELIKQGRLKEAQPIIQQALSQDPKNVSALYLQGVIDYRADNLPAARRDFEAVDKLTPDHGPTLNNLAVILSRQNAPPAAMNLYDKAMQASPLNKQIIGNVDELLTSLPPEQKTSNVAVKAIRRFNEQQGQLEQKMLDQGFYRWGSTWVDKAHFDTLKQQETEIRGKLDALSADYSATQDKIDRVGNEIDDNIRVMHRIDASSWATDASGQLVRTVLPKSYYDLDADNKMLSAERSQEVAKLDSIRAQAKQVEQRLSTPLVTGVQQIIGIEGTPLLIPMPGATSMPAPTAKAVEAEPATQPGPHPIFDK